VPTSTESPFVQAGRLIERAATFTPGDWQRVVHQAQALDAGAHVAAVRRLGARIVGHPQSRALDALNRNAGQAASRAGRAGRDLTAEQACAYAGRRRPPHGAVRVGAPRRRRRRGGGYPGLGTDTSVLSVRRRPLQ
jgi:hypothetical protein